MLRVGLEYLLITHWRTMFAKPEKLPPVGEFLTNKKLRKKTDKSALHRNIIS